MFEFIETIKTYLKNCFAADSDISQAKKPEVYDAYKVGHEPKQTQPEIQVRIMNNAEQVNYTTFCGVKAISIPLQFTAYTGQLSIAKTMYNAQQASLILADKVRKYIYDLIYSENNDILYGRHTTTSPALPMNDGGTMYATSVRFDLIVKET